MRCRVWAKKPYVDPKRIGIWGWVRAFCLSRLGSFLHMFLVVWRVHELQGGGGACADPFAGNGGRGTF